MQMKHRIVRLFILLTTVSFAAAEVKMPERPVEGVTYEAVHRADPPQSVFAVKVDLSNPHVKLRVAPGGPDPDGPGEWQTTLQPASEIAQREGFDVTINASYFTAKNT